jgi:hypothetical protein
MITSEIIKVNNYNTTVVQLIYPQQVEQNVWNFTTTEIKGYNCPSKQVT